MASYTQACPSCVGALKTAQRDRDRYAHEAEALRKQAAELAAEAEKMERRAAQAALRLLAPANPGCWMCRGTGAVQGNGSASGLGQK